MQIVITHFKNPHRFWYKQFGGGPQRRDNRQFQADLDDYCANHYSELVGKTSARYEPVLGEIVAGLDPIQDKWFRCRVDGISDDGSGVPQMRLWAIDEGMPTRLNAVYLMALPEKFSSKPTTVRCGGVKNILPATHLFDAHEDRLSKGFSPTWDKYVIGVFKTFLEGAHQILLDNIVTYTVGREEVSFGELSVVTPKRSTVSAHSVLLEIGLALQADPKSFMIFMSEHHGSESSYCSSEVNESIVQPSASLNVIKTESLGKQMNTTGNEVNENDFDESASMIGTLKPKNKIPFIPASCVAHYPEPVKQKTAERNQKEQQTLQKAHNAEEGCANDGLPVNFDPSLLSNGSIKLNEQQLNFISTIGSANSNTVDLNALPISTMIDTGPVPEAVSDPVGKPKSKLRSRMENMKNMKKTLQTNESNGKPQTTNSTATNPQQTQPNQNDPPPTVRQTKEVASAQNKPKSNQKAAATPTAQQTVPKAHDQPINVRVAKPNKRFEKVVDEEQWVLSRLKYHRLLVHGKCATKPIDAIENANFCSYVHRQLQLLQFTTLYRLQAYAWPNIMRGNSLVCVNGPRSGKTFAYIPAVCSVVKNLIEEKLTPACAGPVGIIICHSPREVQRVACYCRTMLNTEVNHHLAVHDCYARRSVEKTAMLLLNSCALLVTTAACYQGLYEGMKEAFSRERIKVVVIDDLEEILQHSSSALKLLLTKNYNPDLQMIITTCLWNPILASFVQRYTNMVVCIGAYIEAAVYAGVQFRLHVQHHNQKPVELIRYLKQYDYCRERTIVVGKNDGDLDEIVEAATQNSINHLVYNEHTMTIKLGGFTSWDSNLPGHMVLLITTDSLLSDLKVSKAQHIIHYSLPESWSTFTRRFATSFGYYDRDQQEAANMAANTLPRTLVLLDEDNNQQLPKLVNFLELHNVPIPPKIAGLAQKIRSLFEQAKAADGTVLFALCQQVLQFGRCRNIRDCRNRHSFTIDDLAGKELPSVGSLVKLKVLYVFSPAHYSARLEAQRNPTESDWHVVNDYKVFQGHDIAMQMYYANEDRHETHGAVAIHDLCAVFYDHNYWRCKICSFQLGKDPSVVHLVLLRMIDNGRMVEVKPSLLLHLPEEFRKMPGQAIDIQIAGLTPCDGGQDWDKKATLTVQNWVTDYAHRETFHVEGRVLLTLKGIIWVDEMRLVEQLGSLKTAVTKTKFKASIISKKFGVGNDESFQKLQTHVSSIRPPSIEAPTVVEIIAPSSSRPVEKHEFSALEQGNCYNVAVANYYAPDNFYLYRYDHFTDVFNAIESYTANRNNLTPLRDPAVGDYCLACDDDSNDFKRAQVTSVSDERMYLLDFGCELQWNKEDLFELPAPLLQCAPFCAIKAKLAHLHPKWNDCWTEETSLAVYDEVLDKYSSAGSLHAIVVRPMEDPKLTMPGQHCYEVLLTDESSNDPYLIITEIVAEKGLARYHEDGTMLGDEGDNDSPSMQCNFTQEELSALLKQLMQDPSSSEKQATKQKDSESSISPSSVSSTNNVSALKAKSRFYQRLLDKKKGRNKSRSSADRRIILPRLQCDYRCPQTVWKQDDQFVTLRVSAPDVSRYDLTVDMDSLLLQFMVNDDDRYLLAVNLFQPIDPQRTHHEIRGLTIVLRLVKLIPGIRWHTLLNHSAKLPWLRSALEDNDGTESASGEEEGQGHWNNLLPVELDSPADSNSWSGETDDNEGEFDNVTEEDVFFKV
ncbi:putative ATP-dependent RNA helicase TDRD12 [Anopheles bellator]|uniref:putative ATP-dependent RNA helicase TDRD12 n=1 Tax=Anopheles bellator TaxID=139047 RepID=UPI002647A5ED|nr:putative ATP-dependent RNA helicase TDRD12 [Anopheles bellator]